MKSPAPPIQHNFPKQCPRSPPELKTIWTNILCALRAEGKIDFADTTLASITVQQPREASHGDLATNAAMVLARAARRNPRDLAEQIGARLREHPDIISTVVAGPGFVNLVLAPCVWQQEIGAILRNKDNYGSCDSSGGIVVNIEYVSANPTGPLHIAHGRGAVIGDVLANLLQMTGHQVTREYYINDAGGQIRQLAYAAQRRYYEALGKQCRDWSEEDAYPGAYLIAIGGKLAEQYGDRLLAMAEQTRLAKIGDFAIAEIMRGVKKTLAALNIHHDVFISEKQLQQQGRIDQAMLGLEKNGLVYIGSKQAPKGKKSADWQARNQTLFKSRQFGDDQDRSLRKPDGQWTYFASDIAYHYYKFERGAQKMINIWGADHAGYIKRMIAATAALTGQKNILEIKLCQMVRLLRDGCEVTMSKRSGEYIELQSLIDEVGPDAVRFIMLTRRNDAPLDFDFTKATEQSQDNPVFYVQYAHARAVAIFTKAETVWPKHSLTDDALLQADFSLLSDLREIALMQKLAMFPVMIAAAAQCREPHRIVFYLLELAGAFHAHWNAGKQEANLRFVICDNMQLSMSRLALIRAIRIVISAGLRIMGVTPCDRM